MITFTRAYCPPRTEFMAAASFITKVEPMWCDSTKLTFADYTTAVVEGNYETITRVINNAK